MKSYSLIFLCSAFVLAEEVTLPPVEIEEASVKQSYLMSTEEAAETRSISVYERLERDVSLNLVPDSKGEGSVSFRGVDFRATQYTEDGIPLYRSVNGLVDANLLMSDTELHFNDGSGASSLGVSSMGGEVQLISKKPTKPFSSKLDTTISTNDEYYHGYVDSRVGDFYIQADASYFHRSDYELSDDYEETPLQKKGERINSDREQSSVSLKSGVFLDEQTHLGAKVSMTRSQYGIPPNVYTDIVTPVWDTYSRIDEKDLNSIYMYGDYKTKDVSLSFRGYYDDYTDKFTIYNEPTYQTFWPVVNYDDNRMGSIIKGSMKQGVNEHTFILQAERNEHIREGGGLNTETFQADTLKGSYLYARELSDMLKFDGAISYTLLQAKEDTSVSQLAEDKKALDAQVKISYELSKNMFYGSVAKKSRMPEMVEMFAFFPWEVANPGLDPEKSMQYSTGCQQILAETTLMDASLFYYEIKDLIIYRGGGFINREEAQHYGAKIRMESEDYEGHQLRASYAYTKAQDSEGETLEMIPEHSAKLEDTISLSSDWKVYLGYQYLSSRYSSNTATFTDEQKKMDAYHLVDTQVAYEVFGGVKGMLGLKNLLDESYEWRYGYPAEGRSLYISLEWKI